MLQLSKEHPDIKIIAISGGGRISPESYLYMAEKFGAIKTFTKPFDINDFVDAVKTLLK
jgi:DNA-binding NtrC family response regulator